MDLLDKLRKAVKVLRIKGQISTCEEVINKNYAEIGKLYYEQYGVTPEVIFEKQCRAIKNAENGKKELEKKLE